MAKKKNYVDNAALYETMCQWKNDLKTNPTARIPESIGEAILLIATNKIRRHNTVGYTQLWKDEMIGDAVEYCCRYIHNFDTNQYTNVYGYIGMICENAYSQRLKVEKKNSVVKYKVFLQEALDYEDEESEHRVDYDFYRQMIDRVDDYDENARRRREYKKEKKAKKQELDSDSKEYLLEDFF